jgi:hypothetical protein
MRWKTIFTGLVVGTRTRLGRRMLTEGGMLSGIALAQDERIQLDEQRAVLQDIPGEPGVEGGILAGPDPGSVSVDVDSHRQDESLPYDANKGTPSNPSPTFPPQSVTNGGCSTIPR